LLVVEDAYTPRLDVQFSSTAKHSSPGLAPIVELFIWLACHRRCFQTINRPL
jgi:hypothetical protein